MPTDNNYIKQYALTSLLRRLWEQHIFWTRNFITSVAAGTKDVDLVTRRLLQNPSDFAVVFDNFYGNQTGDKFKELLTEHLSIAGDLVKAAKAGENEKVKELEQKWYANADQIAAFLASLNPYWSEEKWKQLMHEHLEMTENEAIKRLKGEYASDIAAFDAIENEAIKMADYMASGLIKQFNL